MTGTIDTRLEAKLGFDRIRAQIADRCSTEYAAQRVAVEGFITDPAAIRRRLLPDSLQAELRVVFLPCAELRKCIPNHTGDWYFTGNYPTPGGNRVVNNAFINYIENRNERAY